MKPGAKVATSKPQQPVAHGPPLGRGHVRTNRRHHPHLSTGVISITRIEGLTVALLQLTLDAS
jgi:hypothetical protein